jgi:predicted RNA-binding Zn-ribbon protein involved in translation (DUF1610 family)
MLAILIKCPKTGKIINTGISMAAEIFETATLSQNAVECPYCGETHVWDKKDAFLDQRRQSKDRVPPGK